MMMTALRFLAGTALLALLTAARPVPAGVSWGGNLGLSLLRSDQWSDSTSTGRTQYWFTGELHLDGSLFTPGTLDLHGSASYLGYRAAGGAASDALNYRLQLNALAQTPVSLGASLMRSTTDFTADSSSGRVGSTRVDGISGTAAFHLPDEPFISATVSNTTTTNRTIGTAPVKSGATMLTAEASQSVDWLNYSLTYDTNWSSGDYAETNYRSHVAALRTQAQLATNVTAQVAATYFLRLPTLTSALNPRMDFQNVSTWLQWSDYPDMAGGGGYTYSDSLVEVPGEPVRQAISHSLAAYGSRQLDADVGVDLNAAASTSLTRANGVESSATGEQVGAGIRWSRQFAPYAALATLSGNVGQYQPSAGASAGSWNVAASANLSRPLETWTINGGLSGSYDQNTGASAGNRTRAMATFTATGVPLGWSVSNLLSCGYSRTESPAFGQARSLNLRLDSQAQRGGYSLALNAGVVDDLAEPLVPGSPPTGVVVPVQFNTQSRYAMVNATIPTVARLFLSLGGRYVSVSSPGRASQWETGLLVTASYYFGAFQFSLYDSLTTGGTDAGSGGTQNLLFFSVSRSFGR
jgi:hypothetical protein